MPPPKLALRFQRLPPILYKLHKHSISSYSKAPRGLSVLSRVMRIFTHSIISPGLSLRQCPSRCTIRAGRNLPDKEFRYLRTVIVTAAVYWGFSSTLRSKSLRFPLTFQHRAGVSPYTSPCGFAETYVFDKQSLRPIYCGFFFKRSTPSPEVTGSFCRVPERELSRSPADTLRAYLCWFGGRAPITSLEDFLDSVESGTSLLNFTPQSQLEIYVERIYLFNSLTAWAHSSIRAHSISSCVSPSFKRL